MPHTTVVKELDQNQFIDRNTVALLNELRQIGNAVAHSMNDPTEHEALRYQTLAEQLIRQFNIATGAAKMPPPGPIPQGQP
jgi:CRISPR/Cas system Type II protein with McrA/HNH and RuvC-like nuclease domain